MLINPNSKIGEVVTKYPKTIEVFAEYGMGCISCGSAAMETIQKGAILHDVNLGELIEKLNLAAVKEEKTEAGPKTYSLLKKREF